MRIPWRVSQTAYSEFSSPVILCLAAIAGLWLAGVSTGAADGCFVFRWNKQKDINEPAQKAIILHDNGQEDMILQVKYDGPAEDFGWLVPVPGLPEVRKGSMDCFYELSKLTQRRFDESKSRSERMSLSVGEDAAVNVIKIETVGAYEVAVLATTDASALSEWLDVHHFVFPKEKQEVLDGYVKKKWYFVAVKIDPGQTGFILQKDRSWKKSAKKAIGLSTRLQLANGELHPLVISFPSETCVFPLAISAVNGKPSEVSLYVLASDPLISRIIFDQRFAAYNRKRNDWIREAPDRQKRYEENQKRAAEMREELFSGKPIDSADPRPSESVMRELVGEPPVRRILVESAEEFSEGGDLAQGMQVDPKDLQACCIVMPRLAGKSWWLTKQVETFAPEEMRDLEFEPAVPVLAAKLGTAGGEGPARCLSQLGAAAVPALLEALESSNSVERRQAAYAVGGYYWARGAMKDFRLAAAVPGLLRDADVRNRRDGCCAARANWDASFTPRLEELLGDSDEGIRYVASECLSEHREDLEIPVLKKLAAGDGPAAPKALFLAWNDFNRAELIHLFSSTNLSVIGPALGHLKHENLTVNEIEPLLTNSLPAVRMMGLDALTRISDNDAATRLVNMLRDPNEGVQWSVRARLRRLTGQNLGPDPAAWEKWWAETKK